MLVAKHHPTKLLCLQRFNFVDDCIYIVYIVDDAVVDVPIASVDGPRGIPDFWLHIFEHADMLAELVEVGFVSDVPCTAMAWYHKRYRLEMYSV